MAVPPVAEPAPPQEPGSLQADDPWGMERQMPPGMHHPGMNVAPTLHLRYRGFVLDLPCSADVDTAACAKIALGIIDHLQQEGWSGSPDGMRRDRGSRGGRDRGDRGPRRGDRDDFGNGDEGTDDW
jgi:hypothetical protein